MTASDAATLFVIYGVGTAALGALALLYWQGYRHRDEVDLTEVERVDTRWEIGGLLCQATIGIASTVIALTVGPRQLGWAGFIYFSLALIMGVHGALRSRSVDRAHKQMAQAKAS